MPVSLCLDFGTAYSKASAWTTDNRPLPLRIGRAVGYTGFTIPTTVVVTNDGFVYFGQEAIKRGEEGRQRVFGDLKQYLTRQRQTIRPLDEVPIPQEFNPTQDRLNVRDVIALYMGFLTYAAMKSLPQGGDDVERRTITMPVFTGKQHEHVKRELTFADRFGQYARDKIEDKWEKGLPLRTARRHLENFKQRWADATHGPSLELAEPLAAVAARMAAYDPNRETRRLSMVVDVGAGTVDFGLFASGSSAEHIGVHPIANAKYSLPLGGNDIDAALVEYILDKARLRGRRRDVVRATLRGERARRMKEDLFKAGPDYEEPVAEADVYMKKKEFLDSKLWTAFVERVTDEFHNRLATVDASWLEFVYKLGPRRDNVDVFLSGGGATLPFLREMIRPAAPQSINNSPLFFIKVATDNPRWATEPRYTRQWRQLEDDYPQLAVSLGGAVFGAGVNEYLAMRQELTEWAGATRR